jgi:replication factor C small subunit
MTHSEAGTVATAALGAVRKGDTRTAMRELESLMIDYGLSATDVIIEMSAVARREYNHPGLSVALADAEIRIGHCNNEFVQVGSFITGIRQIFI